MALIKCAECGRDISDKAVTCPGCGAPPAGTASPTTGPSVPPATTGRERSGLLSVLGIAVLVVVLGLGVLAVIGSFMPPTTGDSEMCNQSAAAAHYIAAEAGANPGGVDAVTDDAIARKAYPALGDKGVAMLGAVVSMELAAGKTPDKIAAIARAACEHGTGKPGAQ